MNTRSLLIFTALAEMLTGIGLLLDPALVIKLLLGAEISDPVVFTITRVAGSAILSLAVACWFLRSNSQSPGANALVSGLLVYNIAVFAILAYSAVTYKATALLIGVVIIHGLLAMACMNSLRKLKQPV
jgi:hypothetical protein